MKRTIVLASVFLTISLSLILTSCSSIPATTQTTKAGQQSYYTTENYQSDYALGEKDGYSIGYAGKIAQLNNDATQGYMNGYTEGHKKGYADRQTDFPPQGKDYNNGSSTANWQDTKYSANREIVKKLFLSVKKQIAAGKNVKDYNGKKVLLVKFGKDTVFDDGRFYVSLINESGKKAVEIQAPSQPGNSVIYLIDGYKGFEVANMYANNDSRAKFVPIVYKGTTSFLTGGYAPANSFYEKFADDLIRKINKDASFGDKFSNQGVPTALKNGVVDAWETGLGWIGVGNK